jgi:hypothetical protein
LVGENEDEQLEEETEGENDESEAYIDMAGGEGTRKKSTVVLGARGGREVSSWLRRRFCGGGGGATPSKVLEGASEEAVGRAVGGAVGGASSA